MIDLVKSLIEERDILQDQANDIDEKIKCIQDSCVHKMVRNKYQNYDPITRELIVGKFSQGDGVENCPICDYDFGFPAWWCPKVKGICDYEGQSNYHLVCKNCGQPEERK